MTRQAAARRAAEEIRSCVEGMTWGYSEQDHAVRVVERATAAVAAPLAEALERLKSAVEGGKNLCPVAEQALVRAREALAEFRAV